MNNRSQAVRLPEEFQFSTAEVFIRKQSDDVILSACPKDWSEYLASGPTVPTTLWNAWKTCPNKSAISDGAVHVGYGHIFLHHETHGPSTVASASGPACGDLCISVIAMSELLFVVEISPRRLENQMALNAFLRNIEILDFPVEASLDYAEIRAHLRANGTAIGPNDLFIAAHARYLGLTLVSKNIREFARVPGLKLDNWLERIV